MLLMSAGVTARQAIETGVSADRQITIEAQWRASSSRCSQYH
jgi:hypothetical protein